MRTGRKLFTPINMGAFDLKHRIVFRWERLPQDYSDRKWSIFSEISTLLPSGMIIYDPAGANTGIPATPDLSTDTWTRVLSIATSADQTAVLHLDCSSFLDSSPDTCIQVAAHARAIGFAGVELAWENCPRAGGSPPAAAGAENSPDGVLAREAADALAEIAWAVARSIGRDRVGVRLPRMCASTPSQASLGGYTKLLQTLQDQEIAYVHLAGADEVASAVKPVDKNNIPAKALKQPFRGFVVAGGTFDLAQAVDLVAGRSADAICFNRGQFDRRLLQSLRTEFPSGFTR